MYNAAVIPWNFLLACTDDHAQGSNTLPWKSSSFFGKNQKVNMTWVRPSWCLDLFGRRKGIGERKRLNLIIYIIILPIFIFYNVFSYQVCFEGGNIIINSLRRKHGLFRRSTWGTADLGVSIAYCELAPWGRKEYLHWLLHAVNEIGWADPHVAHGSTL